MAQDALLLLKLSLLNFVLFGRYAGDDYYFIINRAKLEDRGEYIIRAENHYGFREEVVFLNVQRKYQTIYIINYDLPKTFLCDISFGKITRVCSATRCLLLIRRL